MIGLAVLALAVAEVLFWAFPGADVAVSGYFHDGRGFAVATIAPVEAARRALKAAEDVAAFVALAFMVASLWSRRAVVGLAARDWFYGALVFALGPGLLVNVILKPVFGRARPAQIEAFGGSLQFSAPWQISDQCQVGCSFVSGEAAGSIALALLVAMVVRANGERLGTAGLWLGLAFAAALPLFTFWQRIAAGRHFLSDVVFGMLLAWLVAAVLARLVRPNLRFWSSNA